MEGGALLFILMMIFYAYVSKNQNEANEEHKNEPEKDTRDDILDDL